VGSVKLPCQWGIVSSVCSGVTPPSVVVMYRIPEDATAGEADGGQAAAAITSATAQRNAILEDTCTCRRLTLAEPLELAPLLA
jgi:hypothetical protein